MSKRIILGVCGSIAAPKAQSICGALKHCGFDVRAAMTASACKIITPAALSAVLETPPYCDMWKQQEHSAGEQHINWARWADAIVIAPASASCLADLRSGSYNNCVTLLAANLPPKEWFIAPGMSQEMWQQPAVQENVDKLQSWGASFLGPVEGRVASGEIGQRMLEPRQIAEQVSALIGE